MDPLVSVLVLAYNSAPTLPWAVASLLAQTYENWEAVVVDDGSTDGTRDFFMSIRDPRIRYLRSDRYAVRGYSRQRAIDAALGRHIAMLDADDWMFPDRIQQQVSALESDPGIRLVCSGMAIVDAGHRLTGVRGTENSGVQAMSTLGPAPVSFPASMYRRSADPAQRFNVGYQSAEDADFLIRLLLGQRYMVLPDLAYVYSEHAASADKMVRSHQCLARIYLGYRATYPLRSLALASQSLAKAGFWALAGRSGLDATLIGYRSGKPTPRQAALYEDARKIVGVYVPGLGVMPKT